MDIMERFLSFFIIQNIFQTVSPDPQKLFDSEYQSIALRSF